MALDPTVGVVLVNWNSGTLTLDCIQSLIDGEIVPQRIVVYDNASSDGSADEIARRYPEVTLVRGETNIGFTGANNAGIALLLKDAFDYVWVLNNDTVVEKQCLSHLLRAMEADAGIAAASGKILYDRAPDTIWYAGARLKPLTLETPIRGNSEADTGQYDQPEDVPFLTGCCMFVRRSALEHLGTFDAGYFAYCEDEEWCVRARKAGLRLRYVADAVIKHRVSASIGRNDPASGGTTSPFARYLSARNRIWLIKKHAPNVAVRCTALIVQLAKLLGILAGTCALGRWAKAKAVARGIVDGLYSGEHYPPRTHGVNRG